MQPQWILACDIDDTLTGDRVALDQLTQQLTQLRQQGQLFLILPTARAVPDVVSGFEDEGLPVPDAISTQVGTEIYLPPFDGDLTPLPAWERHLRRNFSRQEAMSFLEGIDGLVMQSDKYNTQFKVSCFLDKTPDPDAAADLIQQRVDDANAGDTYRVIWSSTRFLDIVPTEAGKGNAIKFVVDHFDLASRPVYVAGDSGNDRTMFDEFGQGIVVGNAQPELKRLKNENPGPDIYFAQSCCAAAVLEGLRHFGLLN